LSLHRRLDPRSDIDGSRGVFDCIASDDSSDVGVVRVGGDLRRVVGGDGVKGCLARELAVSESLHRVAFALAREHGIVNAVCLRRIPFGDQRVESRVVLWRLDVRDEHARAIKDRDLCRTGARVGALVECRVPQSDASPLILTYVSETFEADATSEERGRDCREDERDQRVETCHETLAFVPCIGQRPAIS